MPIDLKITSAGRAALINSANTGTLPVTITQIGVSPTFTAPAESLSALPAEIKRLAAVAGEVVDNDTIHVTLKDESADAYALRSLALYLSDGTIFACAGQADPILTKTSASMALAAFDIAFADVDAAAITFGDTDFILPTATETRQGIAELATAAEALTGTDTTRILTPARAKAVILPWLLGMDGDDSGLDADLLDGMHADEFLQVGDFIGAANQNGGPVAGFQRMPGGWIIQRGIIVCTRKAWTDVPFLVEFPNACRAFQVSLLDAASLTAITDMVSGKIVSKALARIGAISTLAGSVTVSWLAIGE